MLGPVDREAQFAEEVLEGLLVLGYQDIAQLDEVGARYSDRAGALVVFWLVNRCFEVGVVGERRVTGDTEVVLYPALGRKPVVIPAERVEDGFSGHALVASDDVGLGEGEHVPDVERARDCRGRGVYRVHLRALVRRVEAVGTLFFPERRTIDPRDLPAKVARARGESA